MEAPDLQHRFTYHPPTPGQAELYADLRAAFLGLAGTIDQVTPDSRSRGVCPLLVRGPRGARVNDPSPRQGKHAHASRNPYGP